MTSQQVFQKVEENLPPPIQRKQQPPMKPQMEIQNTPNEILVNMLKTLDSELKKIKAVLKIN
jgi:hypothetical protein